MEEAGCRWMGLDGVRGKWRGGEGHGRTKEEGGEVIHDKLCGLPDTSVLPGREPAGLITCWK